MFNRNYHQANNFDDLFLESNAQFKNPNRNLNRGIEKPRWKYLQRGFQ